MNRTEFIWILAYLLGYFISFRMLRIEHDSEEADDYTRLDRLFTWLLSALSWGMVLLVLVSTWFKKIGATGYWNKPVKTKAAK